MEDRVCCDRSLMSAPKAMTDAAILDFTEMFAPAPRTDESIWPAKGEEKLAALLFRLKSLHEFDEIYGLLSKYNLISFQYPVIYNHKLKFKIIV